MFKEPRTSAMPSVSPGYMGRPTQNQPPCVTRLTSASTLNSENVLEDRRPLYRPTPLPKTISFDGRGSWAAFYAKFQLYTERHNMSDSDKKYQLCLALEAEASKFMALVRESNPDIPYSDLVAKLEKRFALQDEPEVIRMQFQSAYQRLDEDLFKWADRLMTLAGQAFVGLPDKFIQELVVARFCQGAQDKDAGHHVLISRPGTLDDAITKYKWYQFTQKTMHGHGPGPTKEVRQLSVGDDKADHQVQTSPQKAAPNGNSGIEARISALEAQNAVWASKMDSMVDAISDLSKSTKDLTSSFSKTVSGARPRCPSGCAPVTQDRQSYSSGRSPDTQDRPRYNSKQTPHRSAAGRRPLSATSDRQWRFTGCYNCGEEGHFSRICPIARTPANNRHVRAVSFEEEGNGQRLEEMGSLRSNWRSLPTPSPFH